MQFGIKKRDIDLDRRARRRTEVNTDPTGGAVSQVQNIVALSHYAARCHWLQFFDQSSGSNGMSAGEARRRDEPRRPSCL